MTNLQQALKEVDHERANLLKIREELEKVRQGAKEQAERDRSTIHLLQMERAKLHQKLGELEGSLAEIRVAQDRFTRPSKASKKKKRNSKK